MQFLAYIASTLAIATLAVCAPVEANTQDKGFNTCRDISARGPVIKATCDDGRGGSQFNEVYLGDCFTNSFGNVQVRFLSH
jgi:hypothetical protein